ncbi:hypothetical protein SSABA_v1c03460 [Spiroplasma sabaudiense Ar-1343]|uniref:Lipoprotein n=1 Tax=Spiroplasma sabaudiense Ar-1343 TaxID=1276257 RepID=W6AA90_9MOLU|nr:lipoprotein [Spiroplasma sabaudiense]AHI53755.1 hypothetical protein SSABA_v1c03460 [Spiroplasma sabaudiense Ar-1343]
MKKLLVFLATFTITTSSTATLVSCGNIKNTNKNPIEELVHNWSELVKLGEKSTKEIVETFKDSDSKEKEVFFRIAKNNKNFQFFLIKRAQIYFQLFQFWKFHPDLFFKKIPIYPIVLIEDFEDKIYKWEIWNVNEVANENTIKIITDIFIDALNFDIEND